MEQISIDFAAQENGECFPVQPDHQRNRRSESAIGLVEIGEMLEIISPTPMKAISNNLQQ